MNFNHYPGCKYFTCSFHNKKLLKTGSFFIAHFYANKNGAAKGNTVLL